MKNKTLFFRMFLSMTVVLFLILASVLACFGIVYTKSYEQQIFEENTKAASFIAQEVYSFINTAYRMTEELSLNNDILSMQTAAQTPALASCLKRNDYFELLYAQGMDGMQTGRSAGNLGNRKDRWWFKKMEALRKSFVSQSYYSINTNMPCASIFFPIENDGTMIGILAADIKLTALQDMILRSSDEGSWAFILDGEGVAVAHPESKYLEELYNYKALTKTVTLKDADGKALRDAAGNIRTEEQQFEVSDAYKAAMKDMMAGNSGAAKLENEGEVLYLSYTPVTLGGESDPWYVVAVKENRIVMQTRNTVFLVTFIVSGILALVALVIIFLTARKVSSPVKKIHDALQRTEEGDLTGKVQVLARDEIGQIAEGLNKLIGSLNAIIGRIKSISVKSTDMSGGLARTAASVSSTVEEMNASLAAALERMQELGSGAAKCDDAKKVIDKTLGNLGEIVSRQKTALEETSVVMNGTVDAITRLSRMTGEKKDSIEALIGLTDTGEKELRASTAHIGKIQEQILALTGFITIIDDISMSTSMLSMNAGIEAAHAGEKGAGFSVIATEVRKLSETTSQNAQKMADIVHAVSREIKDSITLTATSCDTVSRVLQEVRNFSEMLSEITRELGFLSSNAGKVTDTFSMLADVSRKVEEGSGDAADEMRSIEQTMSLVGRLSRDTAALIHELTSGLEGIMKNLSGFSRIADENSATVLALNREMDVFKTA